jgi:hypothetical protein
MIPWEPTALLTLVALVVAQRGLGVAPRFGTDGLVLLAGALTAAPGADLSWETVAFWVSAATVSAEQVARLAGRGPGRDLLTLVWEALRSGGLVLVGHVLAEVGNALAPAWLTMLAAVFVCLVLALVRGSHHPGPAGARAR